MSRSGKPVVVHDLDGNFLERYYSVSDAAKHYSTTHPNMLYWIRQSLVKGDRVFSFENPDDEFHHTNYNQYHRIKHVEDAELDREHYAIMRYEVKFQRVSITPCPFHEYPKPMIGSGACQACSFFKGRDRKTREVACSKQF